MACQSTGALGELDFAHSLLSRDHDLNDCTGSLIMMGFWSYQVFLLEHIFESKSASDLLWAGFTGDGADCVQFELCCAHWFDLAVLVELRAAQHRRKDWADQAARLFQCLCALAGWDAKELLNMVAWTRERLT
jgi:hypothetical protein